MNKGKESYNNIPFPIPFPLPSRRGWTGERDIRKKWITGFSVLWRPPACVSWFSSAYFRFPEAIIPDTRHAYGRTFLRHPGDSQAFSDEKPVETQAAEVYRIPCRQTTDADTQVPVYKMEEKLAPTVLFSPCMMCVILTLMPSVKN